ncbi:TPA: beta-galactosidase [Elizabethkingia anophelis]|uniref:beta-galactosidase n=1 Tax=Elizabethkingia anophelis TaxID=1117645 RepID=UPI001627F6E4|nr:beta-galactosidase [Elizabethkingia anophelis]MCT4323305.1 beta-galactosidase [Elizabethkingia anophelis]HAY3536226.1 beta-galactosidase [Elizabethkingia anophelis]HAY3548443.1 beta-galactosidase [Elizabethkingia anophelis]HAY3593187.1 beta-galactosidase [Elizabethkingia anophelis]
MKQLFLFLLIIAAYCSSPAQSSHTFEIKEGSFMYDGKPLRIYSGEMHYNRVPEPYWRHRFKMLKALGLNTVSTYIFWNFHETAPGKWDFTGQKDIAKYIKIAGEEGLHVIVRPGPYVCSEWDWGGIPSWLMKEKDMKIRTTNKSYLNASKVYLNKVMEQIKNLQITNGGPIIMFQVENEFGHFVSSHPEIPLNEHQAFIDKTKEQFIEAGVTVPLFTCNGATLNKGGVTSGALPTINGSNEPDTIKKEVNELNGGKGPYMIGELYPGWFTHWNEKLFQDSPDIIVKSLNKYLKNDISFNIYMTHSGTNFGFYAGGNYDKDHDIMPDITNYDYDSPISEAGWITPKFNAIRNVMKEHVNYTIPEPPTPLPVISIPEIKLNQSADVFAYIHKNIKPVKSTKLLTFEELNQSFGYILYTVKIPKAVKGKLEVPGLRDYAVVYVNNKKAGILNRAVNTYNLEYIDIPAGAELQLMVENLTRVNYGAEMITNSRKGIIAPVKINGEDINGEWQMYQMPLDQMPRINDIAVKAAENKPAFYASSFNLNETGDTFIDMRNFGKGVIFINGINIGRYWNVGPQQSLYIPGCWLKKGKNDLIILDQVNESVQTKLQTLKESIMKDLRPSKAL